MVRRLLALLLLLPLVAACAGGDGPPATDRNPSTADSTVAVTPAVQVADGASTIVVTVTVRNASGEVLAGIDVTIEPGTGPWSLTPASGVATTATNGTAAFAFTATEAGAQAVNLRAGTVALASTAEFTFVAPLALSGYGTRTPTVGDGVTFTANVIGGLPPFTFERSGGALPAGFTFDTATGELAGTPTSATTIEGIVTVRDASGQSANQAYRVAPVAPAAAPSAANSTVATTPTTQVANGSAAIVVTATVRSAANDPLAGIAVTLEPASGSWSVSPASGVVTTAADGTAAFTFTAAQAGQHTVTLHAGSVALTPTAEFTFAAPLTLLGYGTSSALVGEEFAFIAQVGGGLAPFAFERTGDPLPAGFTFDAATGELGGIPTTATPFEGTVTVSDASGQSTSQAYRVEPIAPLPDAPVLQLKGQGRSAGTGSTATVDWPLRIADDDLVLVVVATLYPATHDVTGFTEIVRIPEPTAMQVSAWYRRASGRPSGTAIEVTLGESVPYVIRSLRVSGQSGEAPIGASSVLYELNSGDGIVRIPGIQVGDSALLIGAAVYAGGDVTVEVPSGMMQAWQAVDPSLRLTTAGAFAQIGTAGPTGDRVFKLVRPTGRRRSGILFEIRP